MKIPTLYYIKISTSAIDIVFIIVLRNTEFKLIQAGLRIAAVKHLILKAMC